MAAKKLRKRALFRVLYRTKADECSHIIGHRMTVVADTLEEALARVERHEEACGDVTFVEVVREHIEVWS